MKNGLKLVPLDSHGNPLTWDGDIVSDLEAKSQREKGSKYYAVATEMVRNDPFDGTMLLLGSSRGRSSAVFDWYCVETDQVFQMFMSGIVDTVAAFGIRKAPSRGPRKMVAKDESKGRYWDRPTKGIAFGRWWIVKRGANYGLAPCVGGPE